MARVTVWTCDSCVKYGGGGQSCGTEPLTCGIRRYLQVDSVRIGLNCKTPACAAEPPDVWKPHISGVRSEAELQWALSQRKHTGVRFPSETAMNNPKRKRRKRYFQQPRNKQNLRNKSNKRSARFGASLVAQWLRIRLSMQGTRVRALVWEDPTCHGATKPVRHNYWACALEPMWHNYWSLHA